ATPRLRSASSLLLRPSRPILDTSSPNSASPPGPSWPPWPYAGRSRRRGPRRIVNASVSKPHVVDGSPVLADVAVDPVSPPSPAGLSLPLQVADPVVPARSLSDLPVPPAV